MNDSQRGGLAPGAGGLEDALVGQRIGEYVVRRRMGAGGMGILYEGEHPDIGRRVAIKLLRAEHAGELSGRDLLSEARAASAIHHRGVIDIFSFGHQPGIGPYLVMEYLQGRPLSELLQERAPLPPTEALALLGEVLDALSAAHAAHVIHRDLKPSNIFIVRQSDGSECVKVLDFGLAKRINLPPGAAPSTHSNMLAGTPQYMAPEQILSEPVGPWTDLYAVGLIAFELLTGRHPFPGRSPMEMMTHNLRSPPPSPSSVVSSLPPQLDALILRLLAKEPSRRPSSASEVARELKSLLQQEAPGSPEVMALECEEGLVAPRPSGKPRGRWAVAASALLAGALGVHALPAGMPVPGPEGPLAVPSVRLEPAPAPPVREPSPEPRPLPSFGPVEAPRPAAPVSAPHSPSPARRQEAPQAARRADPRPTPEPAASGTLHLVMKGAWAEVWVDGQRLGSAPPQHRYLLPSGTHELELRNPAFKPYRRTISVPPGATLTHTALLEPTGPEPVRPDL